MKKNKLFLIGIVFSALSYGMEQSLVPHAKIRVKKGLLYDVDGNVDIIVVGLEEQKRLNRTFHIVDKKGYEINNIGAIQFMRRNPYINIMKKEADSDSVEETIHHPCKIIKHRDYNFYQKKMKSRVLVVVEPTMRNMKYNNQREDYEYIKKQNVFYGEKAIQVAGIDLFKCYNAILEKGLQILGDKKDKSIAIPTLSTSVDFPRDYAVMVASVAIANFVENNPYAYSRIELFVKKRFEYDKYCQFFSRYYLSSKNQLEQGDESIKENNS